MGNGGIVHLFVIYGYQGAESDPEKLQLSEHLFAAVLAEARMCCAGQPVILAGDFNADPTLFLLWLKVSLMVIGLIVSGPLQLVVEFLLPLLVSSQLDEDKGSRRDFLLACPIALAAATACSVLPDRWFTPHFAVCTEFVLLGMLLLKGLGFILTFGLLAGLIALIDLDLLSRMRSRKSGMFTFKRLALYLLRFEGSFFNYATPLM